MKGLRRDGKTIPLYLGISEVRLKNQIIFTGVLRDISLQKETEQILKEAKKEAETANRAQSAFLANMSHEIRTPMNAVLGFSELLSTLVTDEKQKSYLNSIRSSGKSLLTIINDILDLSKIEAGKLSLNYEQINIIALFEEIKQIFRPDFRKKNLEFILKTDPGLQSNTIMMDEVRFRQILFNLVGNAVKFTQKGQIFLDAQLKENNKTLDLCIGVEDTGIGIPQSHQARIFGAFQQQEVHTTKFYGGTGLGLTITRRLVKMMKGRIDLKSREGKGSRFTITFSNVSMADLEKVGRSEDDFDPASIDFKPATILVVDDVDSNRYLIKAMLEKTRISVLDAAGGQDALDMIKREPPSLILTDIRMPGMDGFTFLDRLKDLPGAKNIPAVALTASMGDNLNLKSDFSRFDGFLYKPVSLKELVTELCRFLLFETVEDQIISDISTGSSDNDRHSIKELPTLVKVLEQESMQQFEQFKGAMEMEHVTFFANHLKQLGTQHQAKILTQYAKDLNQAVDNFEIQSIQDLMTRFPLIIQSLK